MYTNSTSLGKPVHEIDGLDTGYDYVFKCFRASISCSCGDIINQLIEQSLDDDDTELMAVGSVFFEWARHTDEFDIND